MANYIGTARPKWRNASTILPGVSQVNIYGVKGAIRIKVDPGKLATRNMTFDELAAAVKAGTTYSGAGQFDGKNKSFTLQPQGQLETGGRLSRSDRKTGTKRHAGLFARCCPCR